MPRIRKKTSKRINTHQRAKFKHKVAEGRKKKKKEAKKNPQWKSKKKKDPGIPNNFPYKDQVLTEIAESQRQAAEAKQRKKDEKKAAREGLLNGEAVGGITDVSVKRDNLSTKASTSKTGRMDDVPILLNPDLPNLGAVLEKADVVLHVLDARDPMSFRIPYLEQLILANKNTKLAYILNKIDLVPREILAAWITHLRAQHATFLFRSASSFLPKVQLNDPKAKGKAKETTEDALGSQMLLEYLGQRAEEVKSEALQVAVVGITNSGKSAIVNSLARKPIIPIYYLSNTTEAWKSTTTRAHEVEIEVSSHKLNVIDTPGALLENVVEYDDSIKTRDMLLRSRGRVDKVKNPLPAVEHIVSRADTQDLMVHYNLPAFAKGDCTAFLSGIARMASAIKKGGSPDLTYAARMVLRDWATGKLSYYTSAPAGEKKEVLTNADEELLKGVKTKKEMSREGGLVLIERGELEVRKVELEEKFKVEGESDSAEENGGCEVMEGDYEEEEASAEEEDDEDDDEDDEDGDEDDSDDSDTEKPISILDHSSRKRKTPSTRVLQPPSKRVTFATGTQDGNERRQARKDSRKDARTAKLLSSITPPGKIAISPLQKNGKDASMEKASEPKFLSGAEKLNPVTVKPEKVMPKNLKAQKLKASRLAPSPKGKVKTKVNMTDSDAYDFDQFFKA